MTAEERRAVEGELRRYSSIGNDEFSEACELLMRLNSYRYIFSDKFLESVDDEMARLLMAYEEHFEIVERTEVVPERKRKYKELEPKE